MLTGGQALDVARIIGAEAISDEEAARRIAAMAGWSPAEARQFVAVARHGSTEASGPEGDEVSARPSDRPIGR